MSYITLTKDPQNNIIELVFDQPDSSVNLMGEAFQEHFGVAIKQLEQEKDNLAGIYVRSGKPNHFFAGGDIKEMLEMDLNPSAKDKKEMFEGMLVLKQYLRTLETLGVPVVVGVNGSALGGGYEIALACHYRIMVNDPSFRIGLPEVQLGLLPGGGGIVRLTRMLGMTKAMELISTGKRLKPEKAFQEGLVDQLAADEASMGEIAKKWLLDSPKNCQPWDEKNYAMPGGAPGDTEAQGFMFFTSVNVMNNTMGNLPAPKAILAAITETARVDFATAEIIESRYFMHLLLSQTARNMMIAFFVQQKQIESGASRPDKSRYSTSQVNKLGVLGSGQMGSGIAVCAVKNGIDVVLKDIDIKSSQQGKETATKLLAMDKRLSEEQVEEISARIHTTDNYQDLSSCDLVIESVFEDPKVKAEVTSEVEQVLPKDTVIGSNTSALPITELAKACKLQENFIGVHFFSPAERMPLVEIIKGKKTSEMTLAKAFDFARQIGKTPIVVNDGTGFFTSRVFGAGMTEGVRMLAEGINPVLIENAAKFGGSPVGPLAVMDEISQATAYKALQGYENLGSDAPKQDDLVRGVVEKMVKELDRKGKIYGAGFYEYPKDEPKYLWSKLREIFAPKGWHNIPFEDIKDRLYYIQTLEALKALEEGIVNTVADANIGSIMGIGFPPHTGGVLQFVNAIGSKAFCSRTMELAERYGERFKPTPLLLEKAANNEAIT